LFELLLNTAILKTTSRLMMQQHDDEQQMRRRVAAFEKVKYYCGKSFLVCKEKP